MKGSMRTIKLLAVLGAMLLATSTVVHSQPDPAPPATAPAKENVNYVIRVQWKNGSHLQILTSDGNFSLDTILEKVKINDSDVPSTVSLKGTLRVVGPEKGQLNLFLGRTVPYVTSTSASGNTKMSSYQQMSVGFSSTVTVTFGKPILIQSDAKEEVTLLVKRADS
jgi:hypothetical protein